MKRRPPPEPADDGDLPRAFRYGTCRDWLSATEWDQLVRDPLVAQVRATANRRDAFNDWAREHDLSDRQRREMKATFPQPPRFVR